MHRRLENITVAGAGAIGGTVAAFLAKAGEKVTIIHRSVPHVEAIRAHGLLVDGIFGEQRTRFEKVLFPKEVEGPLDLVFLAVKSQHTEEALSPIIPHLSDHGVIVSLQNGLNIRRIAELVGPSRTIGAMVHMVADYVEPGHITRFTKGEFYIGEVGGENTDRIQEVATHLSHVVPTYVTTNIWGYIWSKQIYSCLLVATALVDAPSSEILKPEWSKRIFVALMGEALEVALAEGIVLEKYDRFNHLVMQPTNREELSSAFQMLPTGSAKGNSGIWRDIKVKHRKTEIEYLTGEVVRLGQKHGLLMKINAQVFRMVKEIEEGQRPMSWENLRSLEKLANERLPQ
jgi:2-dehydropantoate 2-reductase